MRLPFLFVVAFAACSSGSSSPTGGADAGADATSAQDASEGSCFPLCSSSSGGSSGSGSGGGDDGGDDATDLDAQSCPALKAKVESLLPPAQACNPALPGQCSGTTDGICCPVSVSAGNESAENDLAVAVSNYKAACTPSCIGIVCPPTPSNTCEPVGTQVGVCK